MTSVDEASLYDINGGAAWNNKADLGECQSRPAKDPAGGSQSRRDRMRAKLSEIKEELWRRMHQAIPEQGRWLAQVIRGYFAYHAVPTNYSALSAFRYHAERLWLRTLRRRSQMDKFAWERIRKLANDFLPKPKIVRPLGLMADGPRQEGEEP